MTSSTTKMVISTRFFNIQMEAGVLCLKKHNFYCLFGEFIIPESWHTDKQVYCPDMFVMTTTKTQKITLDNIVNCENDDNDEEDFGTILIQDVFGSTTCATYAMYLYDLLCYVKNLEIKESIRIEKMLDEYKKTRESIEERSDEISELSDEAKCDAGISERSDDICTFCGGPELIQHVWGHVYIPESDGKKGYFDPEHTPQQFNHCPNCTK